MSKNIYTVKILNLQGTKLYESEFGTIGECKTYMRTINGECKAMIQKNLNYKGMEGYSEETINYKIKNNKVAKVLAR